MLRKLVIGTGAVALIPTISAATPLPENPGEPLKPPPMRLSDLPIYEAPHAEYGEYVKSQANATKTSYLRTVIQPPVKAVRETAEIGIAHTESLLHTVSDNYHEFRDRTEWIVQYLREEDNKEMRYGAVAMGGLTGLIFGLRGGIIRRVFYAGIGTTAMGSICFPEETKELFKNNGALAKQYINIAYNFLYGVKPGDPQLEVKFPELSFPKNFSEFVDLTVSFAVSAKQAIMPPPSKDSGDNKPLDSKE